MIHSQNPFSPFLLLFLVFFTPSTDAWYDENCSEKGSCTIMFKSYENLMRGEGCRSFYYTGKCSRICTYSLKSLIARHTWSRCAQRCEWSKATIDAIASWLDMCIANPAPDVFEPEDSSDENQDKKSDDGEGKDRGGGKVGKRQSHTTAGWVVVVVVIVVLLVLFSVVLATNPALNKPVGEVMRRALSWGRRVKLRWMSGKGGGGSRGVLDGAALDRKELRNLQRGARRHLKAFRSNLD